MKVLIVGAQGQLGKELQDTLPKNIELHICGSDSMDITDAHSVQSAISEIAPLVVINTAAYTDVDKAEEEEAVAFAVNEKGPRNIARECVASGSRLIHISTDYVFNGNSSLPYLTEDQPDPVNVYGVSKLNGEKAVMQETNGQALIFRTAWLYSAHGKNFVKTMLQLMQERDQLKVVYDQLGSPTWARNLAEVFWKAVVYNQDLEGIYHYTDAGVSSWYDFAVAIQEEAMTLGLLHKRIPIIPIRTSQYPTPARRPANSLLDCSKTWNDLSITPINWRLSLKEMVKNCVSQAFLR